MSVLALLGAMPARDPAIDDPAPETRAGAWLIGGLVVAVAGWTALAQLDAVVHSPGVVRVSGNRQVVQSLAGGVISAIRVHEGDRVRAGEVLIRFATTDTLAQERSLASRVVGLQAELARIRAEATGAATLAPPPEFAALTGADRAEADRALATERAELATQRAFMASQQAVLRERVVQVGHQIQGYRERQRANALQSRYNAEELDANQQLLAKGFTTKPRVLALQRSAAAIDGEIGANAAEIARLGTSGGETRMQMLQLVAQRQQENAERLRAAETELQSLLPQWQAARAQLALTDVRAPVAGTVMGLAANTVGGVAPAGGKLMEIVPSDGELVVESQVSVADANDLRPGQHATVRFTALPGRTAPPLDATVRRISADSFTDEKTGRPYYTATVAVPRSELDRLSRLTGLAGTIRPGTPVDVAVPLTKRTALQFLIDPLSNRLSHTFVER